jgi:hypothetical protein
MVAPPVATLDVTVRIPARRTDWQQALAADPDALAFQSPEWADAIVASGWHRHASREYDFGGRTLVLPLVRRWLPPLTVSLPYGWGSGGVVAPGSPLTVNECSVVFADLQAQSQRTVVRPAAWQSRVWEEAAPPGAITRRRLVHVLDLSGGFDEVWNRRFSGKVRRATRKAARLGVEVERDDTGRLLPIVQELYQRAIPRWAAQDGLSLPLAIASRLRAQLREPARKYAVVGARLGSRCVVWLARVGGRPAAAIVVLHQGRNAAYWRGAMDKPVAAPVAANDLLHRLAIEDACRLGCRRYSMGETASGSSLARFKETFGAVPVSCVELVAGRR